MFKLSVLSPLIFSLSLQCMEDPQGNRDKRGRVDECSESAQTKRYKSWINFKRELAQESVMIDAFFLPNEKNKIVIVFRSGACQIFDFKNLNKSEKEAPSENFLFLPDMVKGMNSCPLKNAFYNAPYLYFISLPTVVHDYSPDQKLVLRQCLHILKKNQDTWENVTDIDFTQEVIETLDTKNNFFITRSIIGNSSCIFTLESPEKKLVKKHPAKDTIIKAWAVSKNKELCAIVTDKNDSPLSASELAIESTHEWKARWKRPIEGGGPHSLIFSKDRSQLTSLSRKSIDQYNVESGDKTITMPLQNYFSSIRYSHGLLVALNKAANKCYYFFPEKSYYKEEEIPEKFLSSKTVRYSDDKSMKVKVWGDKAFVYVKDN